jgi:hypothetical protein
MAAGKCSTYPDLLQLLYLHRITLININEFKHIGKYKIHKAGSDGFSGAKNGYHY